MLSEKMEIIVLYAEKGRTRSVIAIFFYHARTGNNTWQNSSGERKIMAYRRVASKILPEEHKVDLIVAGNKVKSQWERCVLFSI